MEKHKKSKPIKPMGPIVHGQTRSSLISKATRRNEINGTKPMVIILNDLVNY